jgi:hypothetical protein
MKKFKLVVAFLVTLLLEYGCAQSSAYAQAIYNPSITAPCFIRIDNRHVVNRNLILFVEPSGKNVYVNLSGYSEHYIKIEFDSEVSAEAWAKSAWFKLPCLS